MVARGQSQSVKKEFDQLVGAKRTAINDPLSGCFGAWLRNQRMPDVCGLLQAKVCGDDFQALTRSEDEAVNAFVYFFEKADAFIVFFNMSPLLQIRRVGDHVFFVIAAFLMCFENHCAVMDKFRARQSFGKIVRSCIKDSVFSY